MKQAYIQIENLQNVIESLQNELYKANYKHIEALTEIAILNDTVDRQHKRIETLYNDLQDSQAQCIRLLDSLSKSNEDYKQLLNFDLDI